MSCHGNHKGKQGHHGHSPLKHMLHMIICCGAPLLIVMFLPLISRFSPNTGSFIGKLVPFLCPLMMVSMMFTMSRSNKKENCCDNSESDVHSDGIGQLDKPLE